MQQEGYWACKKLGIGLTAVIFLTAALHVLQLQLSSQPPVYLDRIKSRMETFWYQLTQVHQKIWLLKWRARDVQRRIFGVTTENRLNEQKLISDTKHKHKTGY